MKTTQNNWK